jgi:hypothetical protein
MQTVTVNAVISKLPLRCDIIAMTLDSYNSSTVKNKACFLMGFYLTQLLPYKIPDTSIHCSYSSESNSQFIYFKKSS